MLPTPILAPIWAFILISLGGLLLHLRVHPPGESAYYWLPAVVGTLNIVILPDLLRRRRTAGWGYVLTVLTAVVGTITMAWHSAVEFKQPLTLGNLLLRTTFPDIVLALAKIPIAYVVLDHWRKTAARPASCGEVPQPAEPPLPAIPDRAEVAQVSAPSSAQTIGARAAVLLPVVAILLLSFATPAGMLSQPETFDVWIYLGRLAGMLAMGLLMLQLLFSARLRVVDLACGLDGALQIHRLCGATTGVLAIAHPALLYASKQYELGPLRPAILPELAGGMIAALVVLLVMTSVWRTLLSLPYETWHKLHYLSFVVVAMVTAHATMLGGDPRGGTVRVVWLAAVCAYGLLLLWAKLLRPKLARRDYRVVGVTPVSHDTHEVALEPAGPEAILHTPGQFVFARFPGSSLPDEQHPFTISSCPRESGLLTLTIKQSGDFTCRVGELRPGDSAHLEGPYGRFSHLLLPPGNLVMIAGGVGITPMLSMLRYMAATGDGRRVTLVWGNKTEDDILYGDELAAMRERGLDLTIHHVMSAQPDYAGYRGYVGEALLNGLAAENTRGAQVLLCGPPMMMGEVRAALRRLRVPRRNVHSERFAL